MYLAVDIGGTKTLVAVFDKQGSIVEQQKFPTNQDYEAFNSDLVAIVAKLSTTRFSRVVAALPGLIDREHGIGVRMGNLEWSQVPAKADLEKLFDCPALIENDAKLAGLSEALLLKNDFSRVLYITISTGIGIALINNQIIDAEMSDSGGNSIMLEHDGETASWESFASGKAIVQRYGKMASEIDDPNIWKEIAANFATGLSTVISVTEPDVVVLGGGVSTNFEKFKDFLESELEKRETPLATVPPIRPAVHPEEAVIYGCYELARQADEKTN